MPLSPVISTEALVSAMRATVVSTFSISSEAPMMAEKSYRASSSTRVLGGSVAGLCFPRSSAVSTDFSSWRLSHGLVMKSKAPNCIPLTASSMEPHAVIKITGTSGQNTCTFCNNSNPSFPLVANEKFISISIRSGRVWRTKSSAASGEATA